MSTNQLLKNLRRIAAKELQNTRGVPENLRKSDKFALLAVAYGQTRVEDDFTEWCRENKQSRPKYPITSYLKVVDDRLGDATPEPEANMKDPRIKTLSTAVYELAGYTAARKHVAALLMDHSEKEILDALREYVETLDDKDFKSGMNKFFRDGGCAIIIDAQKHRNAK